VGRCSRLPPPGSLSGHSLLLCSGGCCPARLPGCVHQCGAFTTWITNQTGITPSSGSTSCQGTPATIVGTTAAETINGTAGADVIAGLGGNDIINGLGGNDRICGGDGNDTLTGARQRQPDRPSG